MKVDSGRKIPCFTGELKLRQRHVGLMLCLLSYIPSPQGGARKKVKYTGKAEVREAEFLGAGEAYKAIF